MDGLNALDTAAQPIINDKIVPSNVEGFEKAADGDCPDKPAGVMVLRFIDC